MIRFAEKEDRPAIRVLWEVCFPDESGFNSYFFANLFDIRRVLLDEEHGTLCAMLQMLPYRLCTGAGTREITYIYGACTSPACRRQRRMARLLEHSFAIDRAAGRAGSALIPAEPWLFDFYRLFGYEPFFHIAQSTAEAAGTAAELPDRLTAGHIPQLIRLYEHMAPSCHVLRDSGYWQAQLAMFDTIGRGVYGWFAQGRLAAYAFCWEDSVQEAFGLTDARAQGLLHVLGRRTLSCTAPGEERPLGCMKWYGEAADAAGYMNLMLN